MVAEPLVTVLMPCRNANPGFLSLALDSVLAQSSPRWRLLVVDDGTTREETLAVLREIADPRARVVPSDARFITGALNTGMRRAETPYVCAFHGDDLLTEVAIEALTAAIEDDPAVDYLYSARIFVDERGSPLSAVYPPETAIAPADFVDGCPIKGLHGWRVAAGLAIGGMDQALGRHGGDDYDFPWRMVEAGCRFRAIPECLYLARDHREDERLTTHVPLDVQLAHLRAILVKHGIDEETIRALLERRRAGYLRQALFESAEDRREKELAGFDPRSGWREPYRR